MKVQQGLRIDGSDPAALAEALRAVVDFRGDMTITRRSGGAPVVGYVFDGIANDDPARAKLRLLPQDGDAKVSIAFDDIAAIEITGRDTAAGKSFEKWVRKYVEKKKAGESASIFSDEE